MRDLKAMTLKLQSYLPDGDRVEGIRAISHGHSNETYLVEGLDLILRLPASEAPILGPNRVYGVIEQAQILIELGQLKGGPPVPAVHLLERNPAILGDPFLLMERSPGEPWGDWSAPDWIMNADAAFCSALSEQLVEAYASLHRQRPLAALGACVTPREEFERWKAPIIDLTDATVRKDFETLTSTAPAATEPCPCHSDAKLANMLWLDGRLTAVLDWEMAFNGDPLWDLGWLFQFFEGPNNRGLPGFDRPGLWPRDRMVAEWTRRTGRKFENFLWYEAATKAKSVSIMSYGNWLFETSRVTDPRFGAWKDAIAMAASSLHILTALWIESRR